MKKILILFTTILCCNFFAFSINYHNCDEIPNEGQLILYIDYIESNHWEYRQIAYVTYFNKDKHLDVITKCMGWWEVSWKEVEFMINFGYIGDNIPISLNF